MARRALGLVSITVRGGTMTNQEMRRAITAEMVREAAEAWAKAPAHVKTMAGAYVGPVMKALMAINSELEAVAEGEL